MFSTLHGVTVLVCAGLITAIVRRGIHARRRGDATHITRLVAYTGLFFALTQQVVAFGFDWKPAHSWPLHICDLAGILGPIALLTRFRLLRTTVYFWAMGLAVWGIATPTLWKGPDTLTFWLFWINHGGVMLFAIYDVAVRGYRPKLGDWGLACVVSLAYVALVVPLNLANAGWNYGYLGDVPVGRKTPLDWLPAWPWRLLALEILGALMMLLAYLPWAINDRWSTTAARAARPGHG